MSIFEDVKLTWGSEEYVIPANKIMGLIEVIESAIPINELASDSPPRAKLAKAYASAIRYAGGTITQEEVYASFFNGGLTAVATAAAGLIMMMIPPEHLRDDGDENNRQSGKKKG
jgi:hypothetical protein